MKNRIWNYRSFAARLSLWVTLTVAVILVATAAVANLFVRDGILREEKLRAKGALQNAEGHIEDVFVAVETAVKNRTGEIRQNLDKPHEEMYRITREIVETNPIIVGSAIAFVPDYYPDQGRYFSPYSYHSPENGEILTKQLGTKTYDYPTMEWFQTPVKLKKGYWTEPYCDTGGGEITMTTYSYPMMDDKGRVFAVVTADVSLDWLSDMMDSLKYYERSYSMILSRDGTYLTHPRKELVLHGTIFSSAKRLNNAEIEQVGKDMTSGKTDMKRFESPILGNSFIFYKPIKRTGWSVAIICCAKEFFSNATRAGIIVAVIILMMLVLLTFILRKGVHRLTKPLTEITKAVNEVAYGNLQAPLPEIKSKDEMLRLCNSFRTMQKSLTWQMEELKQVNAQKGRIEGELKVASNIQRAMLPKIFPPYPDRDDIDIYGQQTPAKEVGGDLYDFYIRDEKLFFCIGDVSGKGVPASLLMAVTRFLFRNIAAYTQEPNYISDALNHALSSTNETGMFVTFFLGVLDLQTGLLSFSNAGHNPPYVLSRGRVDELKCDTNIPVGVVPDWQFTAQSLQLAAGDCVFLYTDGLNEAEDCQHQQFGTSRMMQVATNASSHPQRLIEAMSTAVKFFIGDAEQSDDLTMLAVEYIKQEHSTGDAAHDETGGGISMNEVKIEGLTFDGLTDDESQNPETSKP